MLGKRSWPAVGRLAGPLRSSAGPRNGPLDHRCRMKMVGGGGVGLSIVAALDKSCNTAAAVAAGGEVIFMAKHASISAQFSARSSPIPVGSGPVRPDKEPGPLDEEFTYVTCRHGPNKSSTTRVYYGNTRIEHVGGGPKRGVFNINSPAAAGKWVDDRCTTSDFLSSCHLCRKGLHGKDIYMYRGEKAFCSAECRQRQITIDERKERCRSEVSRSNDVVSTSPCYSGGRIFSTGIIAV